MSEDASSLDDSLSLSVQDRGTRLINGNHALPQIRQYASAKERAYGRVSSSDLKIVDLADASFDAPISRRMRAARFDQGQYIAYDRLDEGDWDPHAGRRVSVLIAKLEDRVVYLDPDGFVQWDLLSGFLPDGSGVVFNRVATLESTPVEGLPPEQRRAFRRWIGEAVAKLIVDESVDDAMVLLDAAESFAVARRRERARVWYFSTALGVVLAASVAAGAAWFVRGAPAVAPVTALADAGFTLVLAAAAGAIGGFASLALRLDRLSLDPACGRQLHAIDCCARLLVAVIAASSITLVLQIVHPATRTLPVALLVLIALAAGSAERLVPSLLVKHCRSRAKPQATP